MEDWINKKVADRYLCLIKIGAGGMGIVYLAEDVILKRNVVVKMLLPTLHKEKGTSRFMREAKILSQLNHPHIVTIHDFGIWGGTMYLVLEHLDGQNLQKIIKDENPLPIRRILDIFTQILDALEVAHNAGIVHRDLKPSNIFALKSTEGNDFIKILDFGTAISIDHGVYEKITSGGEVIGTPHYMAPEQIMGKNEISWSADIYSIGIILYEMLSGNPPFNAENTMAILLEHLYKSPKPLFIDNAKPDPILRKLVNIANTCLNKNAEDRFKSIQEISETINATSIKSTAGRQEKISDERQKRYMQFYQGPVPTTASNTDTRPKVLLEKLQLLVLEYSDMRVEYSITPLLKIANYSVATLTTQKWQSIRHMAPPDMIVLNKSQEENLTFIEQYKTAPNWKKIPCFICGPDDDLDYIAKSIEVGATDYLSYPFEPREIIKKIKRQTKNSK